MIVRSTMAGIVPVTVLLSGIGFLVSQAAAQQAMTVPELRACACEEQTLATLRQRNDAAHALSRLATDPTAEPNGPGPREMKNLLELRHTRAN